MPHRVEGGEAFGGIDAPNTTPVPDIYFDILFPRLGKGPLKVLLYLVRRTLGFKKEGDSVSLSQICGGIRRRDGTPLDRGTGLTRSTATAAIRELEELGVIIATRGVSSLGDAAVTHYTLRFREQVTLSHLLREESPAQPGDRFPGIDTPNTTPVPDIYFDALLPDLSLAEWRVLLYVVRRTFGFKKFSDPISLDQFQTGIITRAGVRLDSGAGLARSAASEALRSLINRHVLERRRVRTADGGDGVSLYSLTMADSARAALGAALGCTDQPVLASALQARGGGAQADHPGVAVSDQRRVRQPDHLTTRTARGLSAVRTAVLPAAYRVPQQDSGRLAPGGVRMDHPPEPERTTRSALDRLPVVREQYSQRTERQETEKQGENVDTASPLVALLDHIGRDLGVPGATAAYASRLRILQDSTGCLEPDLYAALIAAWRATRHKVEQRALTRPSAAMAYLYTLLCERLEATASYSSLEARVSAEDSQRLTAPQRQARRGRHGGGPGRASAHEEDPCPLQDPAFVEWLAEHCPTPLPDQGPWQAILSGLAQTLTQANYARSLARSALVDLQGDLLVAVPDQQTCRWLATGLATAIQREARASGEPRAVRFITVDELLLSLMDPGDSGNADD